MKGFVTAMYKAFGTLRKSAGTCGKPEELS